MRFDEVWMSPAQLEALATLAASTTPTAPAIEIGTWQGMSAISIARSIQPRMLHVVDHWRGSTDIDPELSKRDNFHIFRENIEEAGLSGNIRIHHQDWHDFASDWNDQEIGFLHLDAEHTADEVSAQIAWAWPRMVKGGIIAGDDYNWQKVRQGLYRQFPRDMVQVRWFKLWWVKI